MAKWHGNIGFATTYESSPGIYQDTIIERIYKGDLLVLGKRYESRDSSDIDNITTSNKISIVSDPYARDNFFSIRYATLNGAKWKVSDVSVEYPRLVLTLGGVYNGE